MQFKDIEANSNIIFGLKMAKIGFARKKHQRKPMGSAYVEAGKIIIASNHNKTHPMSKKYDSRHECIHAEHEALRNIDDASRGVLFVYRETKAGDVAMARPCDGCQRLLRDKNVRKVIYTTENGFAVEKIF